MKLDLDTQRSNWTQLGALVYCSMCHEYGHRCIPATGANPPPIVTSGSTEPSGIYPPLIITPAIEYEVAQLQKAMREIASMVCTGPAPADGTHAHEYDCGECASCAAREALQ